MQKNHLPLIGLFLLFLFIVNCAGPRRQVGYPDPSPLAHPYPHTLSDSSRSASAAEQSPPAELTVQEALRLALLQNPALAVFSYEIRAAEARALQAGLYPNPELDAELENFAGSGDLTGTRGMETTVGLSQEILLGGKRSKAVRAAELEGNLAVWDYESARLDVFTEVRQRFLAVLAVQQRIALGQEQIQLAEKLVAAIRQRVEAGKISPAEFSRARVQLAAQRVELERARRELEAARIALAATWGSAAPKFQEASGTIDTLISLPDFSQLQPLLAQNPDLARYETAIRQRQAAIALEDARRIPNPTLSGGVRRLNESDDNALVMSLSIPLPLSDRNQGARAEARIRLSQTQKEQQATQLRLNAELKQAYSRMQSAASEVETLKNRILPEAQNAYKTIEEGYAMGRFDFLDVLDAQRTLFEARGQYLRALSEFHSIAAGIERLIARELKNIK